MKEPKFWTVIFLIYAPLNLALAQGNSAEDAMMIYKSGLKLLDLEFEDSARVQFQGAAKLFESSSNDYMLKASKAKLAECMWKSGSYELGRAICNKLLETTDPESEPKIFSQIKYNEAAISFFANGDAQKAVIEIDESIKLMENAGVKSGPELASLYHLKGLILTSLSNPSKYDSSRFKSLEKMDVLNSEEFFIKAMENYGENHFQYVRANYDLGMAFWRAGNFEKSLQYFEVVMRDDEWGKARPFDFRMAFLRSSNALFDLGRYEEAESILFEAIEKLDEMLGKDNFLTAGTYQNLGVHYSDLRDVLGSEKYARISRDMFVKVGADPSIVNSVSGNLAIASLWLGKYEDAKETFTKIDESYRSLGDSTSMIFLQNRNNLAIAYRFMGEYDKAEELLQSVIDIYKENFDLANYNYANFVDTKGLIHFMAGDYPNGKILMKESLRLWEQLLGKEHILYANSLNNLARIHQASGEPDSALILANQAIDISKKLLGKNYRSALKFRSPLPEAFHVLGRDKIAADLYSQDIEYYVHFINNYFENLSEGERVTFYNTFRDFLASYRNFVLNYSANEPKVIGDLLSLQLQTKSILLNTTLNIKRRIQTGGNIQAANLFSEVEQLKKDIGNYQKVSLEELRNRGIDLERMENELDEKERNLTLVSSEYAGNEKEYSWQDIRNGLKKKEAAIEIIRLQQYDFEIRKEKDSVTYMALIIKPKSKIPEIVLIPNGNDLESRDLPFYRNAIKFKVEDHQSYNAFWKPFESSLSGVDKVYISSDGAYHQLNLSTLLNPDGKSYLVDKISIEQVTNLKDIVGPKNSKKDFEEGIIVGNPDFSLSLDIASTERLGTSDGPVGQLPGTETEANTIHELLIERGLSNKLLIGKNASEDAIKGLRDPNILHVATHGFFDADSKVITYGNNPLLRSGLLLAGANKALTDHESAGFNALLGKEDGILTAYEAQFLKLDDTELVVLSACETGLGKVQNGEGVYGLQRALRVAGVRSILMSLWKVNDEVTQKLMVSFYKNWVNGSEIRQAFAKAQSVIRKDFPQPYFWGAFVLIGGD